MFVHVDRQQIIAALDTEIARLQQARALIIQTVARARPAARRQSTFQSASASEKTASSATRIGRLVGPQNGSRTPQTHQETTALVTKVPAKEAPKHRPFTVALKQTTALTGNIPRGAVAAPTKIGRDLMRGSLGSEEKLGALGRAPASAFGEAISRSLASINDGQLLGSPSH